MRLCACLPKPECCSCINSCDRENSDFRKSILYDFTHANSTGVKTDWRWVRSGLLCLAKSGFHSRRWLYGLVNAHIIHQHGLWKYARRVRISRPVSANCDIQQNEEWMVINPFRFFWQVRWSSRCIEVIVDVEANRVRLPFHGINVEVVGEASPAGKREGGADAIRTVIAWAMNRSMDHRWFLADILHDVDLAAGGPLDSLDIGTQHPKCRPDPLSPRNLDARFETPVG